ncbi:MAG: hypothetical protein J6U22_02920 [Bacteroidaceae bacterium]|nr:hypothetical protein [Bacteroidaceae bacterium]
MKHNIHFRRIPDYIEQELRSIESQHIIAAAIINASKAEISRGVYRHLGIRIKEDNVTCPEVIYPEKMSGIYARRNRNGIVWILKNLPKITKTYSFESPNFGDPNKGFHTTYWSREVYQRRLGPPRDWELTLMIISQDEEHLRIKVSINAVFDRQHPDFRKDLFFAINLLQEQCRDCHVFDAAMSDEEIARVTIVGWEIFPPGAMNKVFSEITKSLRNPSPERQREIQKRGNILDSMHPTEYIRGKGMNSRYFGAKFGDNIVAFENMDYGNAIYILFDNWQEISQMSRIDIMKRHERDFIRIIHKKGWEKTLRRTINELRGQS